MLLLKDNEFEFIANHIKDHYGVNLMKKRNLIESRLSNYVSDLGYTNYMDYFEFAIKDTQKDELINLINRLTTNHTYFLREEDHFEFFRDTVLPWIDNDLRATDLRIWSAGCSSGQEPYTLSMVLFDYLAGKSASWDSTILASDISNKVLDIAKAGIYTAEQVSDVPEPWLKKYFQKVDANTYKVTPKMRNNVAYRSINLLEPFHFKKPFHAIFCRNVMIYFDGPTKDKLIRKYYDCLMPGGYLFIGHSESLSAGSHPFKYIKPSVYRKA